MDILSFIGTWRTLFGLARTRFQSPDNYCRFQQYQASQIILYLSNLNINLQGCTIIDLGSGRGGYSAEFSNTGGKVVAVDRYIKPIHRTRNYEFAQADCLLLPFTTSSLDFVFCASLIEHVPEPVQLLKEIKRVLAMDGHCYLSFPPFYSINGGHQFKPYHLLGEKIALRVKGANGQTFATSFGAWGLYPLTIRQAKRLIGDAGLQIRDMSTRFSPLNFARLPILGEFLCWHVQFILAKESSD